MKAHVPTTECDPERLESFLSGSLSDGEERTFTQHLNACESCRHVLTEQAAEPETWREAEMLLKPSQFDSPSDTHPRQHTLQIQAVLDALGPTDDPEMLGRLGGYEISGVVGDGGMGVVLKAIDKSLDRTVAIKVMAPHLASSGAARKRFSREAKAAAAVLHANVIAIYSVSNDESLPYLVMPFVRGTSLQKRLDLEGPLPLQEILRIGAQIASGLSAAHAQGLVHRDIKPANILLEEGVERVAITDFGLARTVDDATITQSGMIAGTPQFMSPEQARGEALDSRSDLFSLGSVLYAISTGRPPFRAETSYGVMRRITDDKPTPIRDINPDIPGWLCQIIDKLMSKRATDRFESAAEVAELLEQCLAHVQQPTVAQLPAALVPRSVRHRFGSVSHRWSGVIAMIAALGLGLLGIVAWQATEAPDIAGNWSGEGWGQVVLKKTAEGDYSGTYTDTFKESPGTIDVKWSRLERRYKGAWREGQNRSGKISLRLMGNEIRGAWTTSNESEINPGTPELADLTWKRMNTDTARANAEEGIRVQVLLGAETHSREVLLKNIGFDRLSIMGSGISGTVNGKKYNDIQAVMAHYCRLESFDEKQHGGKKYWRATLFVPQDSKSDGANRTLSQRRIDQMQEQGVQFWLDHQAATKPALLSENPRSANDTSPAPAETPETELQVKIAAPQEMEIVVADQQGQFGKSPRFVAPARLNLHSGKSYRLKLTNIAGREGAEFYPTVETGPATPRTAVFLAHNSMPVEFTEDDFDQALAGNFVTKVIYLPDPDFQELALGGVETLVSTRLEPSIDPITEADRRGSILAVIRLGNKDGEFPGETTASATDEASALAKGLKFLAPYQQLHGLSLDMTEKEFQAIVESQNLKVHRTAEGGSTTYSIPTGDGHTVVVMFGKDSDKCSGIQRLRGEGNADEAASDALEFAEAREIVLSMGSSKFMLDLDTGKTMDPPAMAGRSEQKQMDVQTDQVQPYHYPKELIGLGLQGVEVKASDWDASAAEVRSALAGDMVGPLKQMDLGPERHPTYFFKTRDGAYGVLQLLELVDEPKGIRLRYKTVKAATTEPPTKRQPNLQGSVTDVKDQELVEISLGADDGLRVRDSLIVFRDKTYLGKITVLRVAADKSVARIESRKEDIRRGDLVTAEPEEQVEPIVDSIPPLSEQEAAVARLVLVFFDDKSRRAVPCLVLNAGDKTFAITAGPATIVPEGTPHAIDDTFLDLPGKQPIPVEYDSRSTTEFHVYRSKVKLDAIQLKETVAVREGDSVTAVSTSHVVPKRASVVGLGRRTTFELPDHKIQRLYEDLVEVDQTFPEGTLLFKSGKLVGVTLFGTRYVEEGAKKSYVVPAARIVELCARLAQETVADPMKATPEAPAPPKRLRQFSINHRVSAVACSPDGELIAIANGDVTFPLTADWKPEVEILDAKTGKTVVSLPLATDEQREALIATEGLPHFEVGPLVFSPDGAVLAISTGLGQVKLFNPRSGDLIRSLDDEKARLADKATPEKLKALPRAMGRVASLAFSPDGSLLAVCGSSFEDVADNWDRIERGGLGRSSTGPGRLKVWDVKTGTLKHDLAGHSHAFGVAFSPDGPWLASAGRWSTASNDGNGILLWELEKGAIHRTILIEANGGTHAVVFSPNKKLAAIGSIIFDKENDTRSTAVSAAYPLSGITGWQQTIQGAAMPRAFLPDGNSFVVLCDRKSIRFFDAETGQTKHEIEAADSAKDGLWIDMAVAPKAGMLVIAGAAQDTRGSVEIWQLPGTGTADVLP